MSEPTTWTKAEDTMCRAIRRRSIQALRDLYADFELPPGLEEARLPALDDALTEYGRSRRLLGLSRVEEVAHNIGLLTGEILVNGRRARWVVDGEEKRLGLQAGEDGSETATGPVAEPVRWALERAAGTGPTLSERIQDWRAALRGTNAA